MGFFDTVAVNFTLADSEPQHKKNSQVRLPRDLHYSSHDGNKNVETAARIRQIFRNRLCHKFIDN